MEHRLIIDIRRSLPWRRRIGSDIATAAMWGGWVLLCLGAFAGTAHAVTALGHAATSAHVLHISPLWMLAGAIVAALWTLPRLNKPRSPHGALNAPNYASHFGVDEPELASGRAAQVCTVHHDECGRILAIVSQPPEPPVLLRSA